MTAVQAAVLVLSITLIFIAEARTPWPIRSFWLLNTVMIGSGLLQGWRSGLLHRSFGQIHQEVLRRQRAGEPGIHDGALLQTAATLAAAAAMMVLSLR